MAIHEPKNLTREQKQEVINRHRYKAGGGQISCAHDFWGDAKDKPFGDVFLCVRCWQYFVKTAGMPWWIEGRTYGQRDEYSQDPRSNHMSGAWFMPLLIRCQDQHGNTIHPSA